MTVFAYEDIAPTALLDILDVVLLDPTGMEESRERGRLGSCAKGSELMWGCTAGLSSEFRKRR